MHSAYYKAGVHSRVEPEAHDRDLAGGGLAKKSGAVYDLRRERAATRPSTTWRLEYNWWWVLGAILGVTSN